MQSSLIQQAGLHAALIMDGNGRWASRRGLPRSLGHRAGIDAIRRVVEAAPKLGITTMTLFAFSSDNWRRPVAEVGMLMTLLRSYLSTEIKRLAEAEVRLTIMGRRDRLPEGLSDVIAQAEATTMTGRRLHLQIALDYSSRYAISRAMAKSSSVVDAAGSHDFSIASDVDILIRTGGEKRLSDFLLWESAYAELVFSDVMWPDFGASDLAEALAEYHQRDRRFGGLSATFPVPGETTGVAVGAL